MKKLAIGILAHVDSGKTTLSEAMLYNCGNIRAMGRVDHKDTFLDTDAIEKERGITIFSKQAVLSFEEMSVTLLDTPGHVDFSAETERALWVMDYAVMVISATDGVQSHTRTLWRLLTEHNLPVFIFVNKMDICEKTKEQILGEVCRGLSENCVDISSDTFFEDVAMCDEKLMHTFLEKEKLEENDISDAVRERKIFPCFFGSALKNEGVGEMLDALKTYTVAPFEHEKQGAKVYKISQDEKGARLTHVKVTGGKISVRDKICYGETEEKVSDIRIYSGAKYKSVQTVGNGEVCALCGLTETYVGQGLGFEEDAPTAMLESVFTYKVVIQDGTDMRVALAKLKKLEEEEKSLHPVYNEALGEINIQIMGEVQLEVLSRVLKERFDLSVSFEKGSIVYKETIRGTVEGVGHYEPLRHYAEVHLLIEEGKRGSGLVFETDCREDCLAKNWQRLILTHLKEKKHIGVLTGSAITDMKITLKSGRAHLKHTEGGDFRQATYRAVRHGLRCAESVVLEPFYSFELTVPSQFTGRAMLDLEQMGAKMNPPEISEEETTLRGEAPVSRIDGYQKTVIAYTHGLGRLSLSLSKYDVCENAQDVIEKIGYDCDADIYNSADSVFCKGGAGFVVPWQEVTDYMHEDSVLSPKKKVEETVIPRARKEIVYDEDELIRIFEETYGKIVHKNHNAMKTPKDAAQPKKTRSSPQKEGPGYLLIDGYNIIFAWDKLKEIAKDSLEDARNFLIDKICSFKTFRPYEIILVFDAYKVKGNRGEVEKIHNISVVYTKEAQTADAYIEKVAHELGRKYQVQVASSDALEQMIILGSGARRISAAAFVKEVEEVEKEIERIIKEMT